MIRPNYLRAGVKGSWIAALLLVLFAAAASSGPAFAQAPPADGDSTQQAPPAGRADAGTAVSGVGRPAESAPSKHQLREAKDAYLNGAKKLEHDDLDAAEAEFKRALKLDPENKNYAIAISVARQHRVTELVRQSTQARQTGDSAKADTLLAEARAIDPANPFVLEHSGPFLMEPQAPGKAGVAATPIADRGQMLQPQTNEPWKIQGPSLAGAIQLEPDDAVKSHSLAGVAADVIRNVALAYGIRAVIDDSVEQKQLRFNLENVDYQRAMSVVMSMTHDLRCASRRKDDHCGEGRLR